MSIYGLDLIIKDQTGEYYLIDLNYFPGYNGFDNYQQTFWRNI